MQFKVTPSGGRVAKGHTGWGSYHLECDADGKIVSAWIISREPITTPPPRTDATPAAPPAEAKAVASERGQFDAPKPITPDELRLMADRLDACLACPQRRSVGVLSVSCGECRCAGLSLRTGTCPRNLWPTPGA